MKDVKKCKPTMLLGKVCQTSSILKYLLFKIAHVLKTTPKTTIAQPPAQYFHHCNVNYTF